MEPVSAAKSYLASKPTNVHRIFKSTIGTCFFVFKNSKTAHFINAKYITKDPVEIAELEEEIRLEHPHIYVDKNEKEIDLNADPLAKIKEAGVKEYLAQQKEIAAQITNKDRDMGTSDRSGGENTGIGTSKNIEEGVAKSNASNPNPSVSPSSPVSPSVGVRTINLNKR